LFEQIIDDFPKFREEIYIIVVEREKKRIEQIQIEKLNQDMMHDIEDLQ